MEFFLTSDNLPAPPRKRKQVSNALENLEEYMQLRAAVLGGRMRPMQSAIITVGQDEAKRLDYKFPWRAIVDNMRRLIRASGLEADYVVRKYETATPGIWAVQVTYDPPRVKTAVPHAEAAREDSTVRRTGRRQRAS